MGSRLREKESGRNGSNSLRCEVTPHPCGIFPWLVQLAWNVVFPTPLVKPIWQPKAGTTGGGCGSSAPASSAFSQEFLRAG